MGEGSAKDDNFGDLAERHPLAAARDEETSNVISQEATAAEDFILV